ncbi:glycosyl transferase [Aureococcus anophagefferens]|nr:glycosyl transferase [Aureococcus anophagefferens]
MRGPMRGLALLLAADAASAVTKFGLDARGVGACATGDAACVAAALVREARTPARAVACSSARGTVAADRRRVDVALAVARAGGANASAPWAGRLFVDYGVGGDAFAGWVDVSAAEGGVVSLWLPAAARGTRARSPRPSRASPTATAPRGSTRPSRSTCPATPTAPGDAREVVGQNMHGAVVVARHPNLEGGRDTPVRLRLPATRGDVYREALAAVDRFGLASVAAGGCAAADRACIARRLLAEAERPIEAPRCRLHFDRPRDGEVLVLGHIDMELSVEVEADGAWSRAGRFAGRLFLDAWPSDPGTALFTMPPLRQWLDLEPEHESYFSVKLAPPRRRPGGGGTTAPRVSGTVDVNVVAYGSVAGFCEPTYLHGTTRVTYRPFHEPSPPAPVLDRAALAAGPDPRAELGLTCAYATILYDTSEDTGYAHGLLALRRSLVEAGAADPLYALLGDGVDARTRAALRATGVRPVNVSRAAPGEESSALPALGLGQWAKLQLWKLPADRVLYLARASSSCATSTAFAALERRGGPPAPLAAVDDYFSGGVLFLALNAAEETAFADTLAQDSGRYVYGEQDFLNVHFGGAHARLGSEYKCLAKDVPENRSALASICAVLEFSSCPTRWGGAWKPWHGMAMLADPDFKICTFRPTGDFENLVDVWRGFHERALADLAARGLPPLPDPEPYSHAAQHYSLRGTT